VISMVQIPAMRTEPGDPKYADLCVLCAKGVAVTKMADGRYAHLGVLVCEANKVRLAAEGQGVDMARLMWDSYMQEQCPFCRTVKRKMTSFCWPCFKSLPPGIGRDIKRMKLGNPLRLVAFIEAMALLKRRQKEEPLTAD
jgi:hypothetical protein